MNIKKSSLNQEPPKDVAHRIFHHFELLDSCTVYDFDYDIDGELYERGEIVKKHLERLDSFHNLKPGGEKMVRKRHRPKNSIGGWVAHKIFKYQRVLDGGRPKWTFWRFQ